MGLHPSTVKTICGLLIFFFNALMMKPSPWNVNLANSEKRHNGLTCNSQGSPYQILGK